MEIHGFSRAPGQQDFVQRHRATQHDLCRPQASVSLVRKEAKVSFGILSLCQFCGIGRCFLEHDDGYTTEHARRAVSAHPS